MKLLDMQIKKHPKNHYLCFNIKLLVDRIPERSEMRFQRKGNCYFSNHGGYVEYFGWGPGHNNGGFCGRHFDIIMEDGSEVTLLGPWSSRSSAMNKEGFTPSLGVSITDDPDVLVRGHTFFAGAVTVEFLQAALAEVGERLIETMHYGEPSWVLESTLDSEED